MPYKVQYWSNGGRRHGKGWRTHCRYWDEESAVARATEMAKPPRDESVIVWTSDVAQE
jgi:hypothetical protein